MKAFFKQNPEWQTILTMVVILIGAFVITKVLRWLITKSFQKTSPKIKIDPTRYRFFKNAVSFIVWLIALAAIVYSLRILVLLERRIARIELHIESAVAKVLKEEKLIEKKIGRKKRTSVQFRRGGTGLSLKNSGRTPGTSAERGPLGATGRRW